MLLSSSADRSDSMEGEVAEEEDARRRSAKALGREVHTSKKRQDWR